ncbi:acyl-CoA thioesterase [Pseudoalteromonas sp. MMG010]|uniref:acyl-CoA thioesterase n=1 Tax=Pseudoalteromonas sp. MMG010 TaxID=2822685 RepID=UPI001B39D00A|nr:acyl-CoA thioesterase [Pseudoalteromonas sp. MMG010]MBQ4833876.1 acyl-CoA thioesterase [Pseudoalteromonas sp. MMG010]
MLSFKQQHPIHTDITVAWGDMDALQHVNNVVYLRYFETARIDFLSKINLFDTINANGVGPVISENNIRYKRPVTFPDTLTVSVAISDIKSDRFTMQYQVFSHAQQAITTTGHSTVVMFDFKTATKTTITEPLLSALQQHACD